jgi:hypothetical protein
MRRPKNEYKKLTIYKNNGGRPHAHAQGKRTSRPELATTHGTVLNVIAYRGSIIVIKVVC